MSTLKVDTISRKSASGVITLSDEVTATLSSSSNIKAPLNASGDAPVYACRAWVNFNGAFGTSPFTVANGGIYASGNVSSVTDNGGNGDYTVNFATAMPDANYAVLVTGEDTSAGQGNAARGPQVYADGRAAGSVRVQNFGWTGSAQDVEMSVIIIR